MKEINISCYSNKRVRTLIRFFHHIFINSIQPDINMAEEFEEKRKMFLRIVLQEYEEDLEGGGNEIDILDCIFG